MPKPENITWVTTAQMDDFIDQSEMRVLQLAQEGVFKRGRRNEWDFILNIKAYLLWQRKMIAGSGSLSLTEERTRLTKAQADREEVDLKEKSGELVNSRAIA